MAEYKIAILNRIANVEAGVELVCNNPTDSIRFEFDEEWSGVAAKTARFSWDGKYIDVPFSGNVVQVPEIYQTNHVYVGVFADNITSTPVKVNSRYSIKCLGGKVVPPSDDVYAEIIALINAGINANDGVSVSSAAVDSNGHLIVTLETGKSFDCGLVKGRDGIDGKDGRDGVDGKNGAGAEEYATMLEDISIMKNYTPQPVDVTGDVVQIDMYQDAPLNVVTHIEAVQSGSGDPSLDNIRVLTGFNSAKLTHNDAEYVHNFDQDIYSGTLNWNTGVLTINKKTLVFDGTESFTRFSDMTNQTKSNVFILSLTDSARLHWAGSTCSHFTNVHEQIWAEKFDGTVGVCCDNQSSSNVYYNKYFRWGTGSSTVADFKAFLSAQHAAGTPVQLCYEIAEPITVQLTPHDLFALQGANTIYCDAGETTVNGRKDIIWLTHNLLERIRTLEEAIARM